MRGETTCWYCETPLKILATIKLADDKKICPECHSRIKSDLKLNLFNSKKMTTMEIESHYEGMGRNFNDEIEDLNLRKEDIKNTGIFHKVKINIATGASAIGTSSIVTLVQLNDDRVVFNPKDPQFYYLLSTEFNGPTYKTVFDRKTSGNSITDSESDTVKKGKSGRVTAGALIGTAIFPGVGTVVGAYAGSKGKDKKKKKRRSETEHNSKTSETTKEVEMKSLAKIVLYRISDQRTITLTLDAYTKDYNELLSLQIHEPDFTETSNSENDETTVSRGDAIAKLKEMKELLDLGILSKDEFEEKKSMYMDLL